MKRRIISSFLVFSFLSASVGTSLVRPVYAGAATVKANDSKADIIKKFESQSSGKFKLHEKDGQVFASGILSEKRNFAKANVSSDALNYLEENKALFGIGSNLDNLQVDKVQKDENGGTVVKVSQKIKGIKVKDRQINVSYDNTGTITSVNGEYEQNTQITALGSGSITAAEAVDIAKKQFAYKTLKTEPAAEKIIVSKDGKLYEACKVNIYYREPEAGNWDVYVELHSGQVLLTEDNIRYDGVVSGSGIGVGGESKSLNLYQYGAGFYMQDSTKALPTVLNTYNLNHSTTNGTLISNTTSTFASEDFKAGVSAHHNAGVVLDFYKNLFNRNSLDGSGMIINSFIHYSSAYNNAFWDGHEMIYGDGDGVMFTYLSGDLDIVGHEMTHGLVSSTANLNYQNQPGTLNESMADVFGVLIETWYKYNVRSGGSWKYDAADWVMGDDVYTPGRSGDALRSLTDPAKYGQPANMNSYICTTVDNGGVHANSGIPSRAAALIAGSIGMEKTARIYYRALTNYMIPTTDFLQAYCSIRQAASDLYGAGNSETAAVDSAFSAVGIADTDPAAVKAVTGFVTRLYQQCLSREPDTSGLNYWKDKLLSKTNTGADVADSFIFSPEFTAANVPDDKFIDIMYRTFFDRVGDGSGVSYWMDKFANGMSRLYVLSCFVNSAEFSSICGSCGISRGSIQLTEPADLYPEVTAFTYRFYDRCLGRKPDASGLNYWVKALTSGQTTGADISLGFVFSPEFTARNLSDSDFITVMYRVFFNREPDSGGQTYWVNILKAGRSRMDVLRGFVSSPEFASICSGYGIKPGKI